MHTKLNLSMHCTSGISTDTLVPCIVRIRITNELTCAVAHARLCVCHKVQIYCVTLLKLTKHFYHIYQLHLYINSQKWLLCSGLEPHNGRFFQNLKTMVHDRSEPTPNFKYNTLLCCIKWNICIIYMRYSSISLQERLFC